MCYAASLSILLSQKTEQCFNKIGLTGGDVKARVANAKKDPTYLLADVEIVATSNSQISIEKN